MALYRAVLMLPCTSRNAKRVWRETDEKATIIPLSQDLNNMSFVRKQTILFMIKILRIKSYHFYVLKIIVNYNVFDRVLSNIFLSENGISKEKTSSKAHLRISKKYLKATL